MRRRIRRSGRLSVWSFFVLFFFVVFLGSPLSSFPLLLFFFFPRLLACLALLVLIAGSTVFFLGFPFFLPTCSSFLLIGPLTLRFRGVLSNSSFSPFYFSSPLFFGGGLRLGWGGVRKRERGDSFLPFPLSSRLLSWFLFSFLVFLICIHNTHITHPSIHTPTCDLLLLLRF